MKIQILNKSNSNISFLLEGAKPAFVNALRRVMVSEIPTMAIEWVDFKKNDSAIQDEILANRLGQVPLTFDRSAYNLITECKCKEKGCSRCQVKLVCKVKGPSMVYSEDLKSKAKDVKAVFDKIPIVELFEGQDLEFEATAQLGVGRAHVKWQGAVVGYKNLPKINIRGCDDCGKCVDRCPKKILKIENGKLVVTDPIVCIICLQCVDACPKGAIEIKAVEDSFIFNVETVCGLKAEDVLISAGDALEGKLKEFAKALKKIK